MSKIINTFKIENNEEFNDFKKIIHSFWVDVHSTYSNADILFNIYSNKDNYKFIDEFNLNQIAFYIAFSAENYQFINLLINESHLKNKKYDLSSLTKLESKDNISDILLCICNDIFKEKSVFNLESKNKSKFLDRCAEYFILKCNDDSNVNAENNLFTFIQKCKVKYWENKHIVLDLLLSNNADQTFLKLFQVSNKKQQFEIIDNIKNSHSNMKFVDNLILRYKLNIDLKISPNLIKKNKI